MPNSKAEFYLRSYIDGDVTGYNLYGDLLSSANMTDRNKTTFAASDGANSDLTTITETFDMDYERSVDAFVLRSNLREFDLQYWDGAAWQAFSPAISYTTNDKEFLLINLPVAVSTSEIKLTMTKTITPNEEKKVYQFEVTEKITEIYVESAEIAKEWVKKGFRNIYSGSVLVVQYPNRGKVAFSLKYKNISDADHTAYKLLKERTIIDSYNAYFYFSDVFELINEEAYYLMNDEAPYDSTPASEALTAGIDGDLDLIEC